MNRLPGMHEMGLEHLLLEEPIPQAPATPTSSATLAPAAAGGGAGAAGGGPRPTAPGKRSIPWAYDAIGPLSQLARQVCVYVEGGGKGGLGVYKAVGFVFLVRLFCVLCFCVCCVFFCVSFLSIFCASLLCHFAFCWSLFFVLCQVFCLSCVL